MPNLNSNLLFFILILFNYYAIYQGIVLHKILRSNVISNENHQLVERFVDRYIEKSHTETGYLYTAYVGYIFPPTVQDCTYYENLLTMFQKSLVEVNGLSSAIQAKTTSTNLDMQSGIVFNYLVFDDTIMTADQQKSIIADLTNSTNFLMDIINNDKCNFLVEWKNYQGKYMCASTSGTIDGTCSIDAKGTKFKMLYSPLNGARAYCFQSLLTGNYCTAEQSPTDTRPMTCNRSWCREWEHFSTTQTRKSSYYNFYSFWNTYMTTESSLTMNSNRQVASTWEQFIPIFN